MLKLISCRTCFLLQIPQSGPLHCDKDCPTRLFATYGATVHCWITGSLSSNTGLASNLTLCFHCTLPQKGGHSDAMNIHAEHVPGPPGSCCDLVNIVFVVITPERHTSSDGLPSPELAPQLFSKLPQSSNLLLPIHAQPQSTSASYPQAQNCNLKMLVSAFQHIPIKRKREDDDGMGKQDFPPV